jgi:hypothetical protein
MRRWVKVLKSTLALHGLNRPDSFPNPNVDSTCQLRPLHRLSGYAASHKSKPGSTCPVLGSTTKSRKSSSQRPCTSAPTLWAGVSVTLMPGLSNASVRPKAMASEGAGHDKTQNTSFRQLRRRQ